MLQVTTEDTQAQQIGLPRVDDPNKAGSKLQSALNTYGLMLPGYLGQELAAKEKDNPSLESGEDDIAETDSENDADGDGVDDDVEAEAEQAQVNLARQLSREMRDTTSRFSNLGYGDGEAGKCLSGLNDGAKLIIQAKERATAEAQTHAATPDGFLAAKSAEADLALFKARLVEREAGQSGNTKASTEAHDAEKKILQQQQTIDTLKTEFAKPGADKSALLLAAYGTEYESARRGSTSTLLADGKGISTKADLGRQFELAAAPETVALLPEMQLEPVPVPVYQASAPALSGPGGKV